MPTTETKTRTITLTGRAPVKIREEEWPMIAEGHWYDSAIKSQANRESHIRVRQHADGRTLVYAIRTSQWQGEAGAAGGELLAGTDDVAAAIYRVGEDIGVAERAIDDCIADLPAVEI